MQNDNRSWRNIYRLYKQTAGNTDRKSYDGIMMAARRWNGVGAI